MISLDTYAQSVFQYAPPATTEHLRRTVWAPLGLCLSAELNTASLDTSSHASLYAVAPVTTNLRCTGSSIDTRLHQLLAAAPHVAPTAANKALGEVPDASSSPTQLAAAARYAAPFTLEPIGLPFCACVLPRLPHLGEWPPSFSQPTTAAPEATEATDAAPAPLVVVVDAGAAEAVLRGSDLYAPGIVTASRVFFAGEEALVAFYVERVREEEKSSSQGLKKLGGEAGATADVAAFSAEEKAEGVVESDTAGWRLASSLTAGITLPPLQYTPLPADATTVASLAKRSRHLVCVGSGTMLMGWRDVLGRRARGTALRTGWTPQCQPSRTTLRALLGLTGCAGVAAAVEGKADPTGSPKPEDAEEDVFFLQNYSSMVPVSLLVEHLPADAFHRNPAVQSPCTVLDACAAPGGKTSLLLSLLHARAQREVGDGHTAAVTDAFRVVCCERSRPRHEQLVKLLHQHCHGARTDYDSWSHALEVHCADTNKYLKKRAASASSADGNKTAAVPDAGGFDAILLDPPCTGLGLRPKLLPHTHTVASIQHSADYQRKLFDSCVQHLRSSPTSPGVLVYSTCTTTVEENEANVVHFLKAYPRLRLARASSEHHRALCELSVTTYPMALREETHPHEGNNRTRETTSLPCSCLLADEIVRLQLEKEKAAGISVAEEAPLLVLRFMPRRLTEYTDHSEDSVGFFVAVFLSAGHATRSAEYCCA